MNKSKILISMISVVAVIAIALGIMYACGVFNKSKSIKFPIVYPDSNIKWVESADGALRATFSDKINLDKSDVYLTFSINGFSDGEDVVNLSYRNSTSGYDTWRSTFSFGTQDSAGVEGEFDFSIRLYNNAILNENGVLSFGEGFVIEFSDFAFYTYTDDGDKVLVSTEIESIEIYSIWQNTKVSII